MIRPGPEPPPQAGKAAGKNHEQRSENNRQAPEPPSAGQPAPPGSNAIGETVKARIRAEQHPAPLPARCFIVLLAMPMSAVPLLVLDVGRRTGILGRLMSCHCLSLPAPLSHDERSRR